MNQSNIELQHLTWTAANTAGLMMKTGWEQAGRSLLWDAKPAAIHREKDTIYYLYAVDQTSPKQVETIPVTIDLLASIFTVTRSAKYYRDLAQTCYHDENIGLAKSASLQKKHLYALKDNGLVAAVRNGRVQAVGTQGCLTIYRGEKYCFHSLLRPKGALLPEVSHEPLRVAAKSKSIDESRLIIAVRTLEELPSLVDDAVKAGDFERMAFSARKLPEPPAPSMRYDYSEEEDYD